MFSNKNKTIAEKRDGEEKLIVAPQLTVTAAKRGAPEDCGIRNIIATRSLMSHSDQRLVSL